MRAVRQQPRQQEPTRVLEIGNGLPIWYTGRLLQGLGAEVSRVEPPGGIPVLDADRDGYRVLNGRKALLKADLRSDRGREILRRQLESHDVLLLGVRPERAVQWGLDPDSLARVQIIHAWLNAFGQSGPYANLAAHDINASAVSGVAWIEGMHQRLGAQEVRTPISDLGASLFMVIAVLDAIRERAAGADGLIRREVSMADSGLALLAAWAPGTLAGRLEALGASPFYGIYRTHDEVTVGLGALEPWQQSVILALAPSDPDSQAADPERAVAAAIGSMDAEALYELARRNSIALTPVLEPREVLRNPHFRDRLSAAIDPGDPWRRVLDPGVVGGGAARLGGEIGLDALLFQTITDAAQGAKLPIGTPQHKDHE